jgi:hypothetical protein
MATSTCTAIDCSLTDFYYERKNRNVNGGKARDRARQKRVDANSGVRSIVVKRGHTGNKIDRPIDVLHVQRKKFLGLHPELQSKSFKNLPSMRSTVQSPVKIVFDQSYCRAVNAFFVSGFLPQWRVERRVYTKHLPREDQQKFYLALEKQGAGDLVRVLIKRANIDVLNPGPLHVVQRRDTVYIRDCSESDDECPLCEIACLQMIVNDDAILLVTLYGTVRIVDRGLIAMLLLIAGIEPNPGPFCTHKCFCGITETMSVLDVLDQNHRRCSCVHCGCIVRRKQNAYRHPKLDVDLTHYELLEAVKDNLCGAGPIALREGLVTSIVLKVGDSVTPMYVAKNIKPRELCLSSGRLYLETDTGGTPLNLNEPTTFKEGSVVVFCPDNNTPLTEDDFVNIDPNELRDCPEPDVATAQCAAGVPSPPSTSTSTTTTTTTITPPDVVTVDLVPSAPPLDLEALLEADLFEAQLRNAEKPSVSLTAAQISALLPDPPKNTVLWPNIPKAPVDATKPAVPAKPQGVLDGVRLPNSVLANCLDELPCRLLKRTERLAPFHGDNRLSSQRSVEVIDEHLRVEKVMYDTTFEIPQGSLLGQFRYVVNYLRAFWPRVRVPVMKGCAGVAFAHAFSAASKVPLPLVAQLAGLSEKACYVASLCECAVLAYEVVTTAVIPEPRKMAFVPHVVSSVLMDMPASVTEKDFDQNAKLRVRRLASLPVSAVNSVTYVDGSLQVAKALATKPALQSLNWRWGVKLEPDQAISTDRPCSLTVTESAKSLFLRPNKIVTPLCAPSLPPEMKGALTTGACLMALYLVFPLFLRMAMTLVLSLMPLPRELTVLSLPRPTTSTFTNLSAYGVETIFNLSSLILSKSGSTAPVIPYQGSLSLNGSMQNCMAGLPL